MSSNNSKYKHYSFGLSAKEFKKKSHYVPVWTTQSKSVRPDSKIKSTQRDMKAT